MIINSCTWGYNIFKNSELFQLMFNSFNWKLEVSAHSFRYRSTICLFQTVIISSVSNQYLIQKENKSKQGTWWNSVYLFSQKNFLISSALQVEFVCVIYLRFGLPNSFDYSSWDSQKQK